MAVGTKSMPIRTPTTLKEGQRLMVTDGMRDTKLPEKKPYKRQKAITPPVFLIPVQAKARRAEKKLQGMRIFKGPALSATRLGIFSG